LNQRGASFAKGPTDRRHASGVFLIRPNTQTRCPKQAEAGHLESMCSLQKTKIPEIANSVTRRLRHRSLSQRQKFSNIVTGSQTQTLHNS